MSKIMTDLSLRLSANTAELRRGLATANKNISSFKKQTEKFNQKIISGFKGIGIAIAGAFALDKIKAFASEAISLAGELEGVENAFKKFRNSAQILKDLKKATRGTVSEMELMKQAIKAENFNIPMQALASGLEFATKRASQTGESVDYLVNSFVTGLGRKSVLILDNLGISAAALNEEIDKTGDFMQAVINITNNELAEMGDVILTDKQKTEQLKAAWLELKTTIGQDLIPAVGDFKTTATEALNGVNLILKDETIPKWKFLLALFDSTGLALTALTAQAKANAEQPTYLETLEAMDLAGLNAELEQVQKSLDFAEAVTGPSGESLFDTTQILEKINLIKKQIEIVKELSKPDPVIINNLNTIEGIEAEITKQKEIQKTATGELLAKTNIWISRLEAGLDALKKFGTDLEPIKPKIDATGLIELKDIETTALADVTNSLQKNIDKRKELEKEYAEWKMMNNQEQAQFALESAASTANSLAMLFEAQKQRELSSVGSNEKKRAAVERKYAKKQKQMSIIQAIINGAVGVTKAFAQGGILGFITGALVAAATAAQIALISSQSFAKGGIVYGETLATVGDYPGARSNPEIIAPLDKLGNIINRQSLSGQVIFRIDGTELVGVLENQTKKNNTF